MCDKGVHLLHRNTKMENFHGLFDAKWVDITDEFNYVYYDVTFIKDVGKYKAGDKVDSAYWKHYELTLYIGDDTVGIKFGLIEV